MDHTLSTKTAKFTSLENLYEYGNLFKDNSPTKDAILKSLCITHSIIDQYTVIRQYSIYSINMHIVSLRIALHQCITLLSHLANKTCYTVPYTAKHSRGETAVKI